VLAREPDVEPDREAAALLRAAVRPLHHARAAAGDDGEVVLGEEAPDLARGAVGGVLLADAGGAEDRDSRGGDAGHELEAGEELVRDSVDVEAPVAGLDVEEALVLHYRSRSMCVALMARPSARARPM